MNPTMPLPRPATPGGRRSPGRAAGCLLAGAVLAAGVLTAEPAVAPRRELFVDRALIERLDNVTLKLHQPVRAGAVLKIDRPWEGPANFGSVIIRHRGRFMLYYRAMTLRADDASGRTCVAVSPDGITWTKPALARDEFSGRTDANFVVDDAGQPLIGTVWFDARPGVPDDERVKALRSFALSGEAHTAYKDPKGPKRIELWASGDGLVFRRLPPGRQPTLVSDYPNSFDGGNTLFWSEAEQRYVLYYRIMTDGRRRAMARTTSEDLRTWSAPVPMTYGDAPAEQFYINNTEPYFRAPQLYVGLAARFMEGRSAVTDEQAKAIGLKSPRGIVYNRDCSDAVLLTTRAGSIRYDRTFSEALIRPGIGAGHWVSRTNYPLTGVFPAGPEQMMVFVTRNYLQDAWHIERLLLRMDGFASVNAPHAGGSLLTKPLKLSGGTLQLNYSTSAAGGVRVELLDMNGRPLPGYALADCPEIIGDEIEHTVAWKDGVSLDALAGQVVRLRFVLHDADLYSFQAGFTPEPPR
jgi:hypothetical protein